MLSRPSVQRPLTWLVAILVGGALIAQVRHEGNVREHQFCELVIDNHLDVQHRIHDQQNFLDAPISQDPSNRGLTQYVRTISLPQLREDYRKERGNIPPVCHPELEAAIEDGRLQRTP